MFWGYYWTIAAIAFFILTSDGRTRGKPLLIFSGALLMPFILPVIPIIGVVIWLLAKNKK